MKYLGWVKPVLFEYNTSKYITVKNKKFGLWNRLTQLLIFIYIIGFAIIYRKGYQDFSDIESAITTKVKGVIYTNFSNDDFIDGVDPAIYNRVWDVADYVVPPSESNELFVATNVIITPNQTMSTCPEDGSIPGASCNPNNNTCEKGKILYLGNGPMTGECVENENQTYSCEIMGWCPLERDDEPLKSGGILADVRKSTILIKNFISFSKHGITRRNVLYTDDIKYLKSCHYHPVTDNRCPIFLIEDIINGSGGNFSELVVKGCVFAININWECNLDSPIEECIPTYSFNRLDKPDAKLGRGYNFRYANYYMNNKRTLNKMYGIDFVIVVTGRGGKWSFPPLFLNIGAGMGLFQIATMITDALVIYCSSHKKLYKCKKYEEVEHIYHEYKDENINVSTSDYSYQTMPPTVPTIF